MNLPTLFWALFLVFAQIGYTQISSDEMLADLSQLEQLIVTKHIRPYRLVSKEELQLVVEEAKDIIRSKDSCDEACYVAVLKVIAALNDGHSMVTAHSREKLFGYIPLTTTWFKEGLIATRVPKAYADILGGRLVAIDGVDIDSILTTLKPILPHGNLSRFKKYAYSYLRLPGLLYGLGITGSSQKATFTFSKNGETKEAVFEHMSDEVFAKTTFIHIDELIEQVPIYRENTSDYYWYRYDSTHKIFYFNYNRVGNMEDTRASEFANQMWSKVDSLDIEKFILDIRDNGGGQFAYSMSFTQGILDRPTINVPGKLFVISGYNTFSAALDMLRMWEQKTHAIILGEAPGDYAASSGDAKPYTLSNSGITIQLSSVFHPTIFLDDMRREVLLDKYIEPTWRSYEAGKDEAYEYIVGYKQPPPKYIQAERFKGYVGRYTYDVDKHIILSSIQDKLFIAISKTLTSPLYTLENNTFSTEIQGFSVELKNQQVRLHFPDGKRQDFPMAQSKRSALEYLYEGNIETARPLYQQFRNKNPETHAGTDGYFSNQALFAFFELRKDGKEKASAVARGILNLGIELNQGDAPSCEFALRFY